MRDFQDLAHLGDRNIHPLGDLFRGGLATKLLHKLPAGADQLVDRLDHVHRDADSAGLISNGARDGLTDPPGGIGRELVTAAPLKLVHRLHQADVALLNQVEKLQPAVGVLLRDGDHQAQVGLNQLFLGLFSFRLAAQDQRESALEIGQAHFARFFDLLQFRATRAQLLARFGGGVALGSICAALQPAGLALERMEPLDSVAHLVNQTLLLE